MIPAYQFRPESTQHLFIANHRAVRAVADFAQGSRTRAEFFTWIFTERTRVKFDVRGAEPGSLSAAMRLEGIIQSAAIP
jgi:hypothetical protein